MTEVERVNAWLATDRALDDTTARIIAGWWHGGMSSGLYSFISTGFISHKALGEVEWELKTAPVDEIPALEALAKYFRKALRRCRAADEFNGKWLTTPSCRLHPGRRGVQPGWNARTSY